MSTDWSAHRKTKRKQANIQTPVIETFELFMCVVIVNIKSSFDTQSLVKTKDIEDLLIDFLMMIHDPGHMLTSRGING